MKALLIVLGIAATIVAYGVITHKVIGIMDEAGCKWSFIEWLTALVPIVNLIMLINNWSLLDRDTWLEQFKNMNDKMRNERERHNKAKQISTEVTRKLLGD